MICISVTPVSRKLAKVDLLNAARQCDLVELCLDHLAKPPDIKELLERIDRPILVSCRRPEDGGHWKGTEEQRLTLLRETIVEGPTYIELDMEAAKNVPRYGNTKRVVSYTSLHEPLNDVEGIFDQAANLKADVVKFTWPTATLEAAWPLLRAVSGKRDIPVVGQGLGRAGLTFSLLGRKYGSPWIYAALEKGMEVFPDQATVGDLDEIYGWREIDNQTRFIGIIGFGETETTNVRVFNKTIQKVGLNARCLPLASSKFDKLKQMLDVLKINALLTSCDLAGQILSVADHLDEAAQMSQHADMLLKQPDGWHAYNSIWRSVLIALEDSLGNEDPQQRPLDRRSVLIIGTSGLARSLIYGITKRKGLVSVTGTDDSSAHQLAQQFNVRFVPSKSVYDTLADVVVLADPTLRMGSRHLEFNPSYLRHPMTVIDAGTMPAESGIDSGSS